jgi:electron transfer flavoprotein beta subunit
MNERLSAQATFASKVEMCDSDELRVTREVDGGLETLSVSLPAVVTCDLRLNEPRFATLPNMMKARKKTIETIDPASCNVNMTPTLTTLSVAEPAVRAAGVTLDSVAQLVEKLREEAKVI